METKLYARVVRSGAGNPACGLAFSQSSRRKAATALSRAKRANLKFNANRRKSELVKRAAAGEEILITKNGKPRARLIHLQSPDTGTLFGAFGGKIHMSDDFDQLPHEFAPYL